MAQRYLVTGAAGFIASRVCELLLDAGHQVVAVDNLNDAYDPRLKEWRLAQLRQRPHFVFHQVDIADRPAIEQVVRREAQQAEPLGAVINLAARAGVRPSVTNPAIYFRVNVDGTLNLLDLCRDWGIKKFVLASTSSLYGSINPVPFREDADTNHPLSPYAASKKAAEALAFTYHHLHKLDVTVFRYFTVYGPAGRPDMSVFRFVQQIAEGQSIAVYGDGAQSRDFTYVDDIARGTVAGIAPLGYEVINLGSDGPVRLNQVIELIATQLGEKPRINYFPAHPADVPATWADVQKAKRLLNWSPQVPVVEGLGRAVQWYLDNRKAMSAISLGSD